MIRAGERACEPGMLIGVVVEVDVNVSRGCESASAVGVGMGWRDDIEWVE